MVLCLDAFFPSSKVSAKSRARRSCGQKILLISMFLLASLGLGIMTACAGGAPMGQTLGSNPPTPPNPPTTPPPTVETCNETGNILPGGNVAAPTDLQIDGVNCIVDGSGMADGVTGSYVYRNVNIWHGGTLTFKDAPIDFHAHSILVEADGTLQAGSGDGLKGPLTIWLWGSAGDGIPSITCMSGPTCGVAADVWASNTSMAQGTVPTTACNPAANYADNADNGVIVQPGDCFYQYSSLEPKNPTPHAYFGSKVLAVSAGGTLELLGAKGVRTGEGVELYPADSGTSWARLTQTLVPGASSFTIDRLVPTWKAGDHIVVTTTDYLPSHTEELTIQSVTNGPSPFSTITVTSGVKYPHSGVAYNYTAVAAATPNTGPLPDPAVTNLLPHHVETRAIVALLSRDIVVASEGATPTYSRTADHFPTTVGNYYGGSTIVRQGFKTYQVQGVEFYHLGQGGVIGHYPVHFHMVRGVPQPTSNFDGTYVADSSVVDSMTRFITLHATQGVTLARNVGYKSIGHGFYLEDATETNNRLYSNVAISVQGALADAATNPRMVPGILDLNNGTPGQQIADNPPFDTDVTSPAAFWITNTWNDFEYNAAVGVGACGACYWMPPSGISGPSKDETWQGYAGMQKNATLYGGVPLQKFWGNSCSAAMNSISTVGQTSNCNGIVYGTAGASTPSSTSTQLVSVVNSAPNALPTAGYPVESPGQRAKATLCDSAHQSDCSTAPPCTGANGNETDCMATVIEHYTTSFNWAQTNYAAIWLRGWWYLLDNSAITDVQNGGLTFISGGGYSRSDSAQGFWSVLKNSILVGNTQPIQSSSDVPMNPYASNGGPGNPSGLACAYNPQYCVSLADGISFQGSGFAVNQRLFSIYDGPANQYNNIYADIQPTVLGTLGDCKPGGNTNGNCVTLGWFNAYNFGVMQSPIGNSQSNNCILPNAAIAWKQPNGFYYPPAFNSNNLAFSNVGIRHFVVQPLYLAGSFNDDNATIQKTYCTWDYGMFSSSFTDIDRQTELTDNDASLTGLMSSTAGTAGPTVSVTKADFYNAPLVTDQCASGQSPSTPTVNNAGATASTSPYQYLTTAIIAQCAVGGSCPNNYWADACSTPNCYGVPLYRQTVTQPELTAITNAPTDLTVRPSIRMMGENNAQRSVLTLNHGQYYMDTTLSDTTQTTPPSGSGQFTPQVQNVNVFQAGQTYSVFFLFAKQSTQQTYSFYVGKGLSTAQVNGIVQDVRVGIPSDNFSTTPVTSGSWATVPTGGYDSTTGILTVDVNLSGLADLNPQDPSRAAYCQPTTYCSWSSTTSSCQCKAGSGCTDDQICSYATKDIDCPTNGCYGFSITMPSGFQTAATGSPILPPTPILFTAADPYFTSGGTIFTAGTQAVAGACTYATTPTQ